jgi:hypothetical protein
MRLKAVTYFHAKIYIKITTVKLAAHSQISRERKLRRYVTLMIKLCNDDTLPITIYF